jgi:Protein of unknown function (DUF3987)
MSHYSTFREAVEHTVERRRDFFKLIFGNESGYVCVAYKGQTDKSFDETFFEYPAQLDEMCADIDKRALTLTHVYFCPQLFTDPKFRRQGGKSARVKENVKTCTALWADLDTCNPQHLQVPASIVVQSSHGRWQSFWRLDKPLEPQDAEAICLKIAYFHSAQGADRSGWDLTQLMRVPYTPNYKYGDLHTAPIVTVISTNTALYRASDFDVYPAYEALKFIDDPLPLKENLPQEDPLDIMQRYRGSLNPQAFSLFNDTPLDGQDWSATSWKLAKLLSEAGLTQEETFTVVRLARCNKYARDRRPDSALWTEIKKVYVKEIEEHNLAPTPTAIIPDIISEEEIRQVQATETFIERYINWASDRTDAATQYHQAGAFIILSALISGALRLPTSFGPIVPNMWFMILADTTLTRKTTSMNLPISLLEQVMPNAIMATDGSPEGILSALRDRAKQPSIYLRDEFAGLLEAITHKEYMSSMAETFTKLYDGTSLKRLLRKEEIKISNPIFIMYAGGTKTRIQDLLNESHIETGFIPRFVFITAVADPDRVRPVGPPKALDTTEREKIIDEMFDINMRFNSPRLVVMSDGKTSGNLKPEFEAELTQEAWDRYNLFESTLTNAALETGLAHLTPVYDRLAKSMLKAALLIAAAQQGEDNKVTVKLEHILHAIYYTKHWYIYASEIVNGIGKNQDERVMDKIIDYVVNAGKIGVSRADIMRRYRLDSRRAELLLTTLTQRRNIFTNQYQGQPRYFGG